MTTASTKQPPLPCLSCGYDLRGLGGDSVVCPECGSKWTRQQLEFRTALVPGELRRAWLWAVFGSLIVGVGPCGITLSLAHNMFPMGPLPVGTLGLVLTYWTSSLLWQLGGGTAVLIIAMHIGIGHYEPVLLGAWLRRLPILALSISIGGFAVGIATDVFNSGGEGLVVAVVWATLISSAWLLMLPARWLEGRIQFTDSINSVCFATAWVTSAGPPLILLLLILL